MDDLQMINMLMAEPEPSPDVVARGRNQLQNAMRGAPAQRRRSGWLIVSVGLGGAAAATAIALVVGTTTSAPPTGPPGGHGSTASGRQILLAAADVAAKASPTTDRYWHLKLDYTLPGVSHDVGVETWTARDGANWIRLGAAVYANSRPNGFVVGGTLLTYRQVEQLPTDPARLDAWMIDSLANSTLTTPPDTSPGSVAGALVSLLAEVPAPPAARSAAFRALAGLTSVTSLGTVHGGVGLLIPPQPGYVTGDVRLVIDPATSIVRIEESKSLGTQRVVVAEWTNTLPHVNPGPPRWDQGDKVKYGKSDPAGNGSPGKTSR